MGKGFQGAVLRGLGAKEHRITVTATDGQTDNLVRVWFSTPVADGLLHPDGEAPGNWIRAWFPDPDGGSKQFQRGYTLIDPDPAQGTFAVDFVLHQPSGPASAWAASCSVGDTLDAQRLGEHHFDPDLRLDGARPRGFLLVGDLASYPAIRAISDRLTAGTDAPDVRILLEQHSDADLQSPLPTGPTVTADRIPSEGNDRALVNAVADGDWTGWYVWIAAESTATKHVRTHLRKTAGLPKQHLHAQAYWVAGRRMGTERG